MLVPAPPITPPPHSLVRAADTTRDADPDWEKGLQYAPEVPGGYTVADACSATDLDHLRAIPEFVDHMPTEAQFHDPCETVFGYDPQAVTDRLRRLADATESYVIAHEMWTGELAKAAGLPNAYLAKAPTIVGDPATPVAPRRGLGLLEEAIGDALMGGQAFLHVTRAARPYLWELEKVGNLLFTKLDNAIVCDAGYPGAAPDGQPATPADTAWIYATGPVVVRRAALVMYATEAGQVISTTDNTRYRTASKLFAATFDPAHVFAVPVTLT